ncbi:hypothetical protein WDU94_006119 [Cyamophila willieti]
MTECASNYLLISFNRLKEYIPHWTVLLFFSNAKLPTGELAPVSTLNNMYINLGLDCKTSEEMTLTDSMINGIFAYSEFTLTEEVWPLLSTVTASIIQYNPYIPPPEGGLQMGRIEHKFATAVYGSTIGYIDPNNPLPTSIAGRFYTVKSVELPKNPKSLKKNAKNASQSEKSDSHTESFTKVRIPMIWTPTNEISKCAAMSTLYPMRLRMEYGFILDKMPPPMILVAFEALRSGGIELMIKRDHKLVFKYGYFTSYKPQDEPELVAKDWATMKKFTKYKIMQTKLVVGFLIFDDNVLVDYLLTPPLYISADSDEGLKLAPVFFPPGFDQMEGERPMPSIPKGLGLGDDGEENEAMYMGSDVGSNINIDPF